MPDYTIEVLEGDGLTANWTADVGTFVSLPHDDLEPETENVQSSTGTPFERGTDYEMDYLDGRIKALSGGDISDGEGLTIGYTHRTVEATYLVENVQPVVAGRPHTVDYAGAADDEWHFTKMPVWPPPEGFRDDLGDALGNDDRRLRVRDSSNAVIVDADLHETVGHFGIAGEDLEDPVFFLYYEEAVESLPDEATSKGEPPPYPTPWGRWVDVSKVSGIRSGSQVYLW